MKALIEFIRGYQPGYDQVVRGASPEQIAELEAALGRPVPGAYRDFLATMSQNVGFDPGELTFDIDAVIGLTARFEPIPDRFVPVAADDSVSGFDYWLDLRHPWGRDDALVVRVCEGVPLVKEQLPVYESLRDMLFSFAFSDLRMLSLPEQIVLLVSPSHAPRTAPRPDLATLSAVMQDLGFEALAVTSPEAQLYERGDCAAVVYRVPFVESFTMRIAARERATKDRVADAVRARLPGTS
jgi:hypothetical protein